MKIKKASWLYVALAVVMLVSMFAGLTGADEEPCEPELVVDLIAGQNMVVGTVTVENDDEKVCVTYALDDDALAKGWLIYETHLYIGDCSFDGVLTKHNNRLGEPHFANPIPGQFPYGDDELDGVPQWSFCIDFEDLGFEICEEVCVAAHAVVKRFDLNATSATIYGNIGGYENGQGDIWTIDPIERLETKIFDCPDSVDFAANWYPNALAYDEENHRLYFTTGQNTLMFYDFSSEDEITALTDASGDYFTNTDNVLGAAFGDGAFWYVLNRSGKLYRVDFDADGIATGREEYVMTSRSLTQGDIVYDDGMVFGSSGTGAGGLRGFFTYDTSDPDSFHIVWEGGSNFAAPQLAWGLDAEGNKVLYGTLGGDQQTLWIVDTETGGMSPVTATDDGDDPFVTENRYQDLASSINYAETWESQTAWGEGYRFNERGNWGMWFKYKICEPEPDPTPEVLYLSDGPSGTTDSAIYRVDLDDETSVANLTLIVAWNDFNQGHIGHAVDENLIYAIDRDNKKLRVHNMNDGTEVTNSIENAPTGIVQVAMSPEGVLYFASQTTNKLYNVAGYDTDSPSAVEVASISVGVSGADIAFASDGTCYLWTTGKGLYVLNTSDGTTTLLLSNTNPVTGLALRDNGKGDIVASPANSSVLWILDKTDGNLVDTFTMYLDGEEFTHSFGDMSIGQFDLE